MTLAPYIPFLIGLIYLIGGYFIAQFTSKAILRLKQKRQHMRYALLIEKTVFYVILALFGVSALKQWGFNLNVLLGATGIATVTIGLASQTVISNLISGLFLISEDALRIGDTIKINDITGKISAVDLFSVKLTTENGARVRIPNDLLLKTPVSNLNHLKEENHGTHDK